MHVLIFILFPKSDPGVSGKTSLVFHDASSSLITKLVSDPMTSNEWEEQIMVEWMFLLRQCVVLNFPVVPHSLSALYQCNDLQQHYLKNAGPDLFCAAFALVPGKTYILYFNNSLHLEIKQQYFDTLTLTLPHNAFLSSLVFSAFNVKMCFQIWQAILIRRFILWRISQHLI